MYNYKQLWASILLLGMAKAQLTLYHQMTASSTEFKGYAKHPLGNDYLFAASKSDIYQLNMADNTFLQLAAVAGDVADIEWVSYSGMRVLAIANRGKDCIQYMNFSSSSVQHLTGGCGSSSFEVNRSFTEAILREPKQLSYDKQSDILYARIDDGQHKLVACKMEQSWVSEILADFSDIFTLPAASVFYFSSYSPHKLLIFGEQYNKIVIMGLSSDLSAEQVEVIEDNADAKGIATVGNLTVYLENSNLLLGNCDPASNCELYNKDLKIIDKISDYRLAAYTKNKETIILGVEEPVTTTTSHPTYASTSVTPTDCLKQLYRSTMEFQNTKCDSPLVAPKLSTHSVELCNHRCIKVKECQWFAYDDFTTYCFLYNYCSSQIPAPNTSSYRLATTD